MQTPTMEVRIHTSAHRERTKSHTPQHMQSEQAYACIRMYVNAIRMDATVPALTCRPCGVCNVVDVVDEIVHDSRTMLPLMQPMCEVVAGMRLHTRMTGAGGRGGMGGGMAAYESNQAYECE